MTARIHKCLEVIAFNVNGIGKQRYEFSIQLQDLHRDATLISETILKYHEKLFTPYYHFYRTECYPREKAEPLLRLENASSTTM
jgi:hypothetical protein